MKPLHVLAALTMLTACSTGALAPNFERTVLELPDARPGFTSSTAAMLQNDTADPWLLTGFAVSEAEGAPDGVFEAVLPPGSSMPMTLQPGDALALTVVFAPPEVGSFEGVLTTSLQIASVRLAGGACSRACANDDAADAIEFRTVSLSGRGRADAAAEDCASGVDDDGDGLVDCDDPDCAADPACQGKEFCEGGEDEDGDGLVDCDDPDCADHPACGGPLDEDCGDGVDNDGDGRVDCADPDCLAHPDCLPVKGCEPEGPITCGAERTGTTEGGQDRESAWCGEDAMWTGPEEIWAFVPQSSGEVEVRLRSEVDHDLTVLGGRITDDAVECDPDACVAQAWGPPGGVEQTSFFAEVGNVYFLVVDGFQGDAGAYQLALDCGSTLPESDCDDGLDDDGDGLVDCLDPDCALDPDCTSTGSCQPTDVATCPQWVDTGSNADPGSTSAVDDWCGFGDFGWTGPELAWAFAPTTAGPVTVQLSGLQDDLDLTVLLVGGGGPGPATGDPQACLAQGWQPGPQFEEVIFEAAPGQVYLLVVDGYAGAVSDFTLSLFCDGGPGFEARCDNGIDDDGDGLTDCADPDCQFSPECGPGGEICNDGIDNNGDGRVDCDDLACAGFPGCDAGGGDCCVGNGTPGCDNQLGEDCVCAADPFCCTVEWDGICADLYENTCGGACGTPAETDCADGVDNDNDGLADCADVDCDAAPNCQGPGAEFNCGNGLDDDLDGAVDCDDPDCFARPICQPPQPEICGNGLDDDQDGDVDCADGDCALEPSCDAGDGDCCADNGTPGCSDEPGEQCVCAADPFCCQVEWDGLCADLYQNVCGGTCAGVEVCGNGLDDDFDGAVDCDDVECVFDPSCLPPLPESACADNADNDGDGLTDCDDPDCVLQPVCTGPVTEVNCTNGADDDGDGLFDCADADCAAHPSCNIPNVETNCADGLDNDVDGRLDCEDPDCTLDPNCNVILVETLCANALDDDADGLVDCQDPDCAAHPVCVTPGGEANCTNGIDDDSDGLRDCNDSDCALHPACANGETECADGVDDDGDGRVDCADDDCSASIDCVATGACNPLGELSCGDVITGSNNMAGSTDVQDEYCGYNPGGWFGPEVSWLFTPAADGVVTMTLTGLSADLDIQALVQDGGCDQEDCEANGWNPPPQPESMDWFAFAGTPYYILIDGWQGAISSFTLSVTCQPASETSCNNGVDDDADGRTDCADVDCLGSASCPETNCINGVDDDADGRIDCADLDCFAHPTCQPETLCVDGVDNDADGAVDCDDADCAPATACQPETACEDGLDNDADGAVDCDDADCAALAACLPETQCGNGVDDDGDGLSDCLDPDCAARPACLPEFQCNNGADDDGDGLADCLDADCSGSPTCLPELLCANGVDDDLDGAIDCDDSDCAGAPGCSAEVCGNGFDDDLDGDEDCFDADCTAHPYCAAEASCDNVFDDDADGLIDCDDSDCDGAPGCPVTLFDSRGDSPSDFVVFPLGRHSSQTQWELGVPDSDAQTGNGPNAPYAGAASWCTGCDDNAVDGGRFQSALIAQPTVFDLSGLQTGTLTLTFRHWQYGALWTLIGDEASVVVSDDGGSNTDTVWGPYAQRLSTWTYEEVDLTPWLGGDLTIAFVFDTLFGGGGNDGWYLDDVLLVWEP